MMVTCNLVFYAQSTSAVVSGQWWLHVTWCFTPSQPAWLYQGNDGYIRVEHLRALPRKYITQGTPMVSQSINSLKLNFQYEYSHFVHFTEFNAKYTKIWNKNDCKCFKTISKHLKYTILFHQKCTKAYCLQYSNAGTGGLNWNADA